MTAGNYDFTLEQGATFSKVLTVRDSADALVNLTGYTARMQVRSKLTSEDTLLSLTTENGGITLGGAAGTITLSASATTTAALDFKTAVYDLELITGSTVNRLIEGTITLSREVTR